MDLISIIIPVYNVEEYLERCILSVVNQSYTNLEIILIDDGSTDKSPDICDIWKNKDIRITVIHKKNGGLSDARNCGLSIARGKYIAFVDSDDWIHKEYISFLYDSSQKYDADISACDIDMVYENDIINETTPIPEVSIHNSEYAISKLISGSEFRAVAWNKLYLRSLLLNEHFEFGRYHEDEFFTYRILAKAKKLAYINSKLYYYFQRKGSIMNSFSVKHLDALDAGLERLKFLKINYPSLYKQDKKTFCLSCLNLYRQALLSDFERKKDFLRQIKVARKKVSFSFDEFVRFTLKDKIYIFGSGYFLTLTAKFLNWKREKNEK